MAFTKDLQNHIIAKTAYWDVLEERTHTSSTCTCHALFTCLLLC